MAEATAARSVLCGASVDSSLQLLLEARGRSVAAALAVPVCAATVLPGLTAALATLQSSMVLAVAVFVGEADPPADGGADAAAASAAPTPWELLDDVPARVARAVAAGPGSNSGSGSDSSSSSSSGGGSPATSSNSAHALPFLPPPADRVRWARSVAAALGVKDSWLLGRWTSVAPAAASSSVPRDEAASAARRVGEWLAAQCAALRGALPAILGLLATPRDLLAVRRALRAACVAGGGAVAVAAAAAGARLDLWVDVIQGEFAARAAGLLSASFQVCGCIAHARARVCVRVHVGRGWVCVWGGGEGCPGVPVCAPPLVWREDAARPL